MSRESRILLIIVVVSLAGIVALSALAHRYTKLLAEAGAHPAAPRAGAGRVPHP